MSKLFEIQERDNHRRRIFFLSLESLEELPSELRLSTPHFVLFLACDAGKITTDTLYNFATKIVELGAAYVCAWGEDCERTHDIFDEFLVWREIEEERDYPFVMTSLHPRQSLDEALFFALDSAIPDDEYLKSCGSTLIISVANEKRDALLQEKLSDLGKLYAEVLGAD